MSNNGKRHHRLGAKAPPRCRDSMSSGNQVIEAAARKSWLGRPVDTSSAFSLRNNIVAFGRACRAIRPSIVAAFLLRKPAAPICNSRGVWRSRTRHAAAASRAEGTCAAKIKLRRHTRRPLRTRDALMRNWRVRREENFRRLAIFIIESKFII